MSGDRALGTECPRTGDFVHVGPVVKAETLGLLTDGDDYLDRCREQADLLVEEAEARSEAIRDDAYRDGYKQGYDDAKLDVLKRVMHLDGVFGDQGALISDLVKVCCEAVIGELDDNFFPANLVDKVLAQLRKENQIVVHVANRQTRPVRKIIASLQKKYARCSEISVCGHDLVAADEIVIEASKTYFRWSKEKTLEAIKDCLEEVFSDEDERTSDPRTT